MNRLKRHIITWLLKTPLLKRAPKDENTGEKRKRQNCYNVFLLENNRRELIIESIDKFGVHGKKRRDGTFSENCSVPFEDINISNIGITHYTGFETIYYTGLRDFFLLDWTGLYYPYFKSRPFFFKISKFFFNQKKLVMKERQDILRILLDYTVSRHDQSISLIGLITEIYSVKWVEHPDSEFIQHKMNIYLDSLVASDDLQKNGAHYIVTPKAILTLEEYERADRRHNQIINIQRVLLFLSFMMAFFASVQAKIIKLPCLLDLENLLK
jgi:hypothetical protein